MENPALMFCPFSGPEIHSQLDVHTHTNKHTNACALKYESAAMQASLPCNAAHQNSNPEHSHVIKVHEAPAKLCLLARYSLHTTLQRSERAGEHRKRSRGGGEMPLIRKATPSATNKARSRTRTQARTSEQARGAHAPVHPVR